MRSLPTTFLFFSLVLPASAADERPLLDRPQHCRSGEAREWSSFPESASGASWETQFDTSLAGAAATLRIRQHDVKEVWKVVLNGVELGRLVRDENPMVIQLPVAAGALKPAGNRLQIAAASSKKSDDVTIGPIVLLPGAADQFARSATLRVSVTDGDGSPLPSRITLADQDGALVQTGAESNDTLAVRPGTVYTLDGRAVIPVPPGSYRIFAGRGFEYSLASRSLTAAAGESHDIQLQLDRQVDTRGYVACDTHVHSRTHSGHGDSTVQERMITLAGEGIELPVATDHNVNIDHRPFANKAGADRYFTPVIGNEVTTKWGHFNVFPIAAGAAPPDHKGENWSQIFAAIDGTPGVKGVILNHARDLHSNYRPFGSAAFNDAVGANLDGWRLRANAMEVLNSSATQTDVMQLFADWMTLLNSGLPITPVGCSDSHDVARHFVGQGRTYIRCDDRDVSRIDVAAAADNFVAGKVRVSYGLLVELTVEDRWSDGELARVAGRDSIDVKVRVLGPDWISADKLVLYANGKPVKTIRNFPRSQVPGELYAAEWKLPRPRHDVHWVAIASGPGIEEVYWKTAKPYQPDSPDWTPRMIGSSGAIWLDADGDGRASSARDYAVQVLADARGDVEQAVQSLKSYDEAAAAQAAYLLHQAGLSPLSDEVVGPFAQAAGPVRDGFENYLRAWRRGEQARVER